MVWVGVLGKKFYPRLLSTQENILVAANCHGCLTKCCGVTCVESSVASHSRGLATLSLAACFGDRDKTLALYVYLGSSADQLCLYLNLCFDYMVKFFSSESIQRKGKERLIYRCRLSAVLTPANWLKHRLS